MLKVISVLLFCVVIPAEWRHSAGSTTQNNKTEITYNAKTVELLYYWRMYNLSEPAYLWLFTAYVLQRMGEIVARNM